MTITLEHPDALTNIDELQENRKRISVHPLNKSVFIYTDHCETSYPIWLIKQMLCVLGPAGLCDEIMRDENPSYVERSLKNHILGYVNDSNFENKRKRGSRLAPPPSISCVVTSHSHRRHTISCIRRS